MMSANGELPFVWERETTRFGDFGDEFSGRVVGFRVG